MGIEAIAPGGFLGVLALMVAYMLRAIATDRAAFKSDLEAERARTTAAELKRDQESVRAETHIARADSELALRRAAELEASRCTAELEGLRVRNLQLSRALRRYQRGEE